MALLVIGGILGVWQHYRGAAEFQLEMDASLHGSALWWKALRAVAPPVLAGITARKKKGVRADRTHP